MANEDRDDPLPKQTGGPRHVAPTAIHPERSAGRDERVVHGLDVVAVWVAHERTEVPVVVLGPDSWLVQNLGPAGDGGVEERLPR